MHNFKVLYFKVISPHTYDHVLAEIITALPRVFAAFFLTSNFGASKFGMPWSPADKNLDLFEIAYWFPNDVALFGGIFAAAPTFFAWMAGFSEAFGGAMLLIGFHTRIFSVLIAITMMVAIFLQKWDQGLWSMLPAMGFLWVATYSMVNGGGKLSLDFLYSKYLKS